MKNFLQRFYSVTKAFLKSRNAYDIFHFDFGSTFFGSSLNPTKTGFIDLPFYPKKAKLFVTFNGCEVKQKFEMMKRNKVCPCIDEKCYNGVCNSIKVDQHKAKSVKTLAKYVKHMWALNPGLPRDSLRWMPSRRQKSFWINFPYLWRVS